MSEIAIQHIEDRVIERLKAARDYREVTDAVLDACHLYSRNLAGKVWLALLNDADFVAGTVPLPVCQGFVQAAIDEMTEQVITLLQRWHLDADSDLRRASIEIVDRSLRAELRSLIARTPDRGGSSS